MEIRLYAKPRPFFPIDTTAAENCTLQDLITPKVRRPSPRGLPLKKKGDVLCPLFTRDTEAGRKEPRTPRFGRPWHRAGGLPSHPLERRSSKGKSTNDGRGVRC